MDEQLVPPRQFLWYMILKNICLLVSTILLALQILVLFYNRRETYRNDCYGEDIEMQDHLAN